MPDGIRDEQAVRRFVEHMARTWADWGFPRMPARILMTMTTTDQPALTAAELSQRLGVSPAAVSGAVRYLIQIGMIVREPVPGSRRDSYRLPDDAWYQASATKGDLFKILVDMTSEGLAAIGGTDSPSAARLTEMRDFFAFMQEELGGLLHKWEQRRLSSGN